MPDFLNEPDESTPPIEDQGLEDFAAAVSSPASRQGRTANTTKSKNWTAIILGGLLHLGALVLLGLYLADVFSRKEGPDRGGVNIVHGTPSKSTASVVTPSSVPPATRPVGARQNVAAKSSDKPASEPTVSTVPPTQTGESILWMAEAAITGLRSVSFGGSSQMLVTGGNDRMLRVWEASSGRETYSFRDLYSPGAGAGLAFDGAFVLASGNEATQLGRVRILPDAMLRARPLNGSKDQVVGAHGAKITCLALSRNARNALTGSTDTTVRWWEIKSARELKVFKGHKSPIRAVDFSPKHPQCASVDETGSVIIWELMTGRNLGRIEGLSGGVRSFDYAPDGKLILAVDDGGIAILDVPNLKLTRRLTIGNDPGEFATAACWAPNGKSIIAGTDRGVFVLNAQSGARELALDFPTPGSAGLAPVAAVAISSDGKYIAAAGRSLWVWELKAPLTNPATVGDRK